MTDIKDESHLFDGGDAPSIEATNTKPFRFKASDFHDIVMRGEKPFWEYVAVRANEVLEKNKL